MTCSLEDPITLSGIRSHRRAGAARLRGIHASTRRAAGRGDILTRAGMPVPDAGKPARKRRYLLSGLLVCGACGRRMESAWSDGRPAYRRGTDVRPQISTEDVISYLREQQLMLTYDPATKTLHTGTAEAAATVTLKAS
jgi:hypothetical protein